MRGKVEPNIEIALARAIDNAFIKTESTKDKEFARRMAYSFREAAAKAEALYRSLPDEEKKPPRWM